MSDTYTHKVGIRRPEDNKTNWGNDYREEFADLVDLVLANVIDGNGVLAGGAITAGAGALQASIAAGKALVGGSLYEWSAAADQSLTDDDINYIYIDNSGAVTVSTTAPTGNFAFLGRVPCEGGARVHIKNFPNQLFANLLRTAGADIKLNAHLGTDGTAADAGLSVERGAAGGDARIRWNETDGWWELGLTGSEVGAAVSKDLHNDTAWAVNAKPTIVSGVTTVTFTGSENFQYETLTFPAAFSAVYGAGCAYAGSSGLSSGQRNGCLPLMGDLGTTSVTVGAYTGDGTNPDSGDWIKVRWHILGWA